MMAPESSTGGAIEDGFRLTVKQALSFGAMMCLSLMAALDGSSISVTLPVSKLFWELFSRYAYTASRPSPMSWMPRPSRPFG